MKKQDVFQLYVENFTSPVVFSVVSSVAAFFAVTNNDVKTGIDFLLFLKDWGLCFVGAYIVLIIPWFLTAAALESLNASEKFAKVVSVIVPLLVGVVFGAYWWTR